MKKSFMSVALLLFGSLLMSNPLFGNDITVKQAIDSKDVRIKKIVDDLHIHYNYLKSMEKNKTELIKKLKEQLEVSKWHSNLVNGMGSLGLSVLIGNGTTEGITESVVGMEALLENLSIDSLDDDKKEINFENKKVGFSFNHNLKLSELLTPLSINGDVLLSELETQIESFIELSLKKYSELTESFHSKTALYSPQLSEGNRLGVFANEDLTYNFFLLLEAIFQKHVYRIDAEKILKILADLH